MVRLTFLCVTCIIIALLKIKINNMEGMPMLNLLGTQMCTCGKAHTDSITQIAVGKGVLKKLPEFIKMLG